MRLAASERPCPPRRRLRRHRGGRLSPLVRGAQAWRSALRLWLLGGRAGAARHAHHVDVDCAPVSLEVVAWRQASRSSTLSTRCDCNILQWFREDLKCLFALLANAAIQPRVAERIRWMKLLKRTDVSKPAVSRASSCCARISRRDATSVPPDEDSRHRLFTAGTCDQGRDTADDHLTSGIHSVDLKIRLGDVETERRDVQRRREHFLSSATRVGKSYCVAPNGSVRLTRR